MISPDSPDGFVISERRTGSGMLPFPETPASTLEQSDVANVACLQILPLASPLNSVEVPSACVDVTSRCGRPEPSACSAVDDFKPLGPSAPPCWFASEDRNLFHSPILSFDLYISDTGILDHQSATGCVQVQTCRCESGG